MDSNLLRLTLLFTIFAFPQWAYAVEGPKTLSEICRSYVTLDMNRCAAAGLSAREEALAALIDYREATLTNEVVIELLRTAQASWRKFRDAHCAFDTNVSIGQGSAAGMYELSCQANLTEDRIEDFLRYPWLQQLSVPLGEKVDSATAENEARAAMNLLDATSRQVMSRLDESGKKMFHEASQAWLGFQESACSLMVFQTIELAYKFKCVQQQNNRRTRRLLEMIEDLDG
jgi:uncharacterized protein YecT (DUF1311 family)